jgi:5,10-methylene-tetrahydrofolate dehydrogenase/methenyl tetrahydrofolate cyclohydrolase
MNLQEAIALNNTKVFDHAYVYNKYKKAEEMMPTLADNASQLQVMMAMEDFCDVVISIEKEPKDDNYWTLYPVEEFINEEQISFLIEKNEFYYAESPNSNTSNVEEQG